MFLYHLWVSAHQDSRSCWNDTSLDQREVSLSFRYSSNFWHQFISSLCGNNPKSPYRELHLLIILLFEHLAAALYPSVQDSL
jgi:hypothetical protein